MIAVKVSSAPRDGLLPDHCPLSTFFVPATHSGVVLMANTDHMRSLNAIFQAAMDRDPPWAK